MFFSRTIMRKYIKKAGDVIFYCGFPESSLDKIKQQAIDNGFQVIAKDEKSERDQVPKIRRIK